MSVRMLQAAFTVDSNSELVERPAPGAAPTAFRIWAYGKNEADDGEIFFTERSAELLMAEQEARGRRYPSDFDHLSLTSNRPAESGRASGWHSLAVRPNADGKPELWAVDIEWSPDAKAGLEEDPPRWRYFSPAFGVNKKGEVVTYANFALCINPKMHQVPALAALRVAAMGDEPMNKKALMAALAVVSSAESTEEQKKEALASLAKAFADMPEESSDKKDDDKKEAETEKCAEDGEDKKEPPKDKADDDVEEKKNAIGADDDVDSKLVKENLAMRKRLDVLEVERILDKRPDLPESVRAWCLKKTPDEVKSLLAATPVISNPRPAKPTLGDDSSGGPQLLQGAEREEIDRAMGMKTHAVEMPKRNSDGTFVLSIVKPSDLRAANAAAQKGQA